ncbi:MAG TPA: hypothetical protein VK816_04595 [Jatrophihabitantaceae bacterium]|jgi:hypothetical protein|nr:hypothetical protein [Jatrophihabitantaceae bacterium]
MRTGEQDDPLDPEDDPADVEADRRVLQWGSVANPNTADGELQNMHAFAQAARNATGWRRTVARLAAWSGLLLITAYVLAALVVAIRHG